jgi:prevent-host-death family protein
MSDDAEIAWLARRPMEVSTPCGQVHVASKLLAMTLHGVKLKTEVGVRELHDQLSRYVRHAAEGGEVVVTMRGQRVARLSPLEVNDPLADLRARGLVQEPRRPKQKVGARKRLVTAAPVSDLVAEQRR